MTEHPAWVLPVIEAAREGRLASDVAAEMPEQLEYCWAKQLVDYHQSVIAPGNTPVVLMLTIEGRAALAALRIAARREQKHAKRRTGRPTKNEKDSDALVIAALNLWHGYDAGSVAKWDKATGSGLAAKYNKKLKSGDRKLQNNSLSRFLKSRLGKDGDKNYGTACINRSLVALLQTWNGELPERNAPLHEND